MLSMLVLGLFLGLLFGGLAGVFGTLSYQGWLKKRDAAKAAEQWAKLAAEQAKRDHENALKRERYAENPQVPLRSQARSVVRSAIYLEQKFRTQCGYPISELIGALECKFDQSMTLFNYGTIWEIDHVKPLKSFDLTDTIQFNQAIHPSNLQPLFRGENQSKGSK